MPNETFKDVINGPVPVLVDFFATWCGPCKMMVPILQQLRGQMKDAVRILKMDVDANPVVAQAFKIQGVPTLILFYKGQIIWRASGVIQAAELKNIIEAKVQMQ